MAERLRRLLELREAAEASRTELRRATAVLGRALKERRRQCTRARSSGSRCARVAVLLYALNGYDAACAVAWLEGYARQRGKAQAARTALQRQVEEWFLQSDAAKVGEALAQADATPHSTVGAARVFFADWRAAVWVEEQNESKGVAVPTNALVEKRWGTSVAGSCVARSRRRAKLTEQQRTWARRWRRRVGGMLCHAGVRDALPVEQMRAKAPRPGGRGPAGERREFDFFRFRGSSLRTQIASARRTQFGARANDKQEERGPENGRIFGPSPRHFL